MISQSHEIAGAIFLDISEQLAFMFGNPIDKSEVTTEGEDWSQACISFKGGVSGTLSLTVPRSLCLELAANIMGLEIEELEYDPIAKDALCELLNVVSGHVVRGLQESDGAIDLSVPNFRELTADESVALAAHTDTICFSLDDTPVLLGLALD